MKKEDNVMEDEDSRNWHPLTDSYEELRLSVTLPTGQTFRWSRVNDKSQHDDNDDGIWYGVIRHYVVHLKQKERQKERVYFYYDESLGDSKDHGKGKEELRTVLEDYFRLNKYRLSDLFATWRGDEKIKNKQPIHKINQDFAKLCEPFVGLRLTRPDPVETLFSFICSQNNNIGRITKMVEGLCRSYGTPVESDNVPKSQRSASRSYYAFPTLSQLLTAKEAAEQLNEKGEDWLLSLREDSVDINKCREELTQLMGIGNKVADCISLFSLDKLNAIPVDTHVWKIAQRYNIISTKGGMTPQQYHLVNEFFKAHFGETCGWAHTVLFAAELAQFKKAAPRPKKNKKVKEENEENEDNQAEEANDEENKPKKNLPRQKRKSNDEEKLRMQSGGTALRRSKRLSTSKAK